MSEERKLFGRHHDLFLLLVGFFFTSIVGASLAAYFQNRSWDYQDMDRSRSSERAAATNVFEDVSKLMDKRVYRMRRLNWKLRDSNENSKQEAEEAMKSYRQVLYEWNDVFNRNRALVLRYFGSRTTSGNFGKVHQGFKNAGLCLEEYYHVRAGGRDSPEGRDRQCPTKAEYDAIDGMLEKLEEEIYKCNLELIRQIQEGEVGAFHPEFKR